MTDQDPEQIITGDPAQGREPEPQATGHRTCAQFVPADLPVGTVRHCGNRVHRIHQFSCTTVPDTRKTPPSDPTGQPGATQPPGPPAGNRRHTSPQVHTSSPTAEAAGDGRSHKTKDHTPGGRCAGTQQAAGGGRKQRSTRSEEEALHGQVHQGKTTSPTCHKQTGERGETPRSGQGDPIKQFRAGYSGQNRRRGTVLSVVRRTWTPADANTRISSRTGMCSGTSSQSQKPAGKLPYTPLFGNLP